MAFMITVGMLLWQKFKIAGSLLLLPVLPFASALAVVRSCVRPEARCWEAGVGGPVRLEVLALKGLCERKCLAQFNRLGLGFSNLGSSSGSEHVMFVFTVHLEAQGT